MAMTIAELLAANANTLIPSVGDKAYTWYRGERFEGVITEFDPVRGTGVLEPENPNVDWGYHRGEHHLASGKRHVRGLFFGYEEKSSFSPEHNMFAVVADAD